MTLVKKLKSSWIASICSFNLRAAMMNTAKWLEMSMTMACHVEIYNIIRRIAQKDWRNRRITNAQLILLLYYKLYYAILYVLQLLHWLNVCSKRHCLGKYSKLDHSHVYCMMQSMCWQWVLPPSWCVLLLSEVIKANSLHQHLTEETDFHRKHVEK